MYRYKGRYCLQREWECLISIEYSIDGPGYDREGDAEDQSAEETAGLKTGYYFGTEQDHRGIDDEGKQSERKDGDGQGNEFDQRPDKCIDEPKYYCNNHGYIPRIDCDAGHDPCYYEHGDGLDDKFLNHIGYECVLWLLTRDTHANRRVIYSTKIDKDRRKPKLQNIKYVSISTMKVYLSDSTERAVKDSHK